MDEMVRRSPRPAQGAGAGYDPEALQAALRIRAALAQAVHTYRAEHRSAGAVVASVSPAEAQTLRNGGFTAAELNEWLSVMGAELESIRPPSESRFAVVASGLPEEPVTVEPEPPIDFAAPIIAAR